MPTMIELSPEVMAKLDRLAKHRDQTRAELVEQALEMFAAVEGMHVAEILAAIEEADAGDFAEDAEVEAFFGRFENIGA